MHAQQIWQCLSFLLMLHSYLLGYCNNFAQVTEVPTSVSNGTFGTVPNQNIAYNLICLVELKRAQHLKLLPKEKAAMAPEYKHEPKHYYV